MSHISVGAHGETALELIYRLGGTTAPQLAGILGISVPTASRTLKILERSRLCEQIAVKAWWHPSNGRPRSFYFLSLRDGGRGVAYGAYLAGEEDERKARASYKLTQLPARAAHASLRNDYYLMLLDDAEIRAYEDDEDVAVPVEELWSESHHEFPFFDEGTPKSGRKNARTRYGRVYPDGYFSVTFPEKLVCRYLLEVETQSRARKLLGKVDGYGSYFSRRLSEDPERLDTWLAPIIFLFRQNSTRDTAVEHVSKAISSKAPELQRYLAWEKRARNRGVEAGRLLIFASLEELEKYDALTTLYRPLAAYPEMEEIGDVSLRSAATEVARVTGASK